MIEIVVKFGIWDGDGEGLQRVMALSESDGVEIVSVVGNSVRRPIAGDRSSLKSPGLVLRDDDDLLDARAAGALIGITASGIQYAARAGKLKKYILDVGVRYYRSNVEAYAASRKGGKRRGRRVGAVKAAPRKESASGPPRPPWTMTVTQAARRVGVSEMAIVNAVAAEEVSGKTVNGKLMVHPTSLGAYKRRRMMSDVILQQDDRNRGGDAIPSEERTDG